MTTTTVLIKRNADKNYDRLFAAVEGAMMFGRAASLSERETGAGYEVVFPYLSQEVMDFLAGKPRCPRGPTTGPIRLGGADDPVLPFMLV